MNFCRGWFLIGYQKQLNPAGSRADLCRCVSIPSSWGAGRCIIGKLCYLCVKIHLPYETTVWQLYYFSQFWFWIKHTNLSNCIPEMKRYESKQIYMFLTSTLLYSWPSFPRHFEADMLFYFYHDSSHWGKLLENPHDLVQTLSHCNTRAKIFNVSVTDCTSHNIVWWGYSQYVILNNRM